MLVCLSEWIWTCKKLWIFWSLDPTGTRLDVPIQIRAAIFLGLLHFTLLGGAHYCVMREYFDNQEVVL